MKTLRADLHVHTLLSPCAEVEMIPPLIVQTALEQNIDLIAITDHNASANFQAVEKAARGTELTVLPGMEVQSREDVHLLCLFETAGALAAWQAVVDAALPNLLNQPDYLGEQFVVDETGEFVRNEPRLLLNSTRLPIEEVFKKVNSLGGLVIPAHVDRTSFGLFPTLGLVPENCPVVALEISKRTTPEGAVASFPAAAAYPLVQDGDVHRLDEFLGTTLFTVEAPTLAEIRLALQGADGRKVQISPRIKDG